MEGLKGLIVLRRVKGGKKDERRHSSFIFLFQSDGLLEQRSCCGGNKEREMFTVCLAAWEEGGILCTNIEPRQVGGFSELF